MILRFSVLCWFTILSIIIDKYIGYSINNLSLPVPALSSLSLPLLGWNLLSFLPLSTTMSSYYNNQSQGYENNNTGYGGDMGGTGPGGMGGDKNGKGSTLPVYNSNYGQRYDGFQNPNNSMSLAHPSYGQSLQQRPNVKVFEVRFKCTKGDFVLPDSMQVQRGDFVKVEADRGYDIGIIFERKNVGMVMQVPSKRILGHVSAEEMAILPHKINEETQAVIICRQMASQRGLVITIADVEFQFDRNKLTVIFASEGRVDFRELVRDMFAFFRIRIWMQKVSPSEAVALMELAASDGFDYAPNGNDASDIGNFSKSQSGLNNADMMGLAPPLTKRPLAFQRIESENSNSSGMSTPSLFSSSGCDSPPMTAGYPRVRQTSPPSLHLNLEPTSHSQTFF